MSEQLSDQLTTPEEQKHPRILELERLYVDATMEALEKQEQASAAAKAFKEARELQNDLAAELRSLKQATEGSLEVTFASEASDAPAGSLAWRDVSVTELGLHLIKGFGEKKRGLFREHVPTIGALEDLREQASKTGCHLSDLLPKGVGREIADEIEESQLRWLTVNRDRVASEEPAPEPTGSGAPSVPAPLAIAPPDDWKPSDRLAELEASAWQDRTILNQEIYGRGVSCFLEDDSLDDACVWAPGTSEVDDFCHGYLSARADRDHETPDFNQILSLPTGTR